MSKRPRFLKLAEKYAEYLLFEATDGSIGREKKKLNSANERPLDFNEKRALLDSLIRLVGVKNKVDPEEDESDFDSFKEIMNGDGRKIKSGGASASNDSSSDGGVSEDRNE